MAAAASLSLKPPAKFYFGGNRRDGVKRTSDGFSVARVSRGERFHESIVRLSASTVLFLGLSLRVCSPASARIPPPVIASHSVTENEIESETVAGEENHEVPNEDEERKLEADFEAYKAKVYSLTVPLKVVALRGSVPPSWIKDFMSSQGKRVRLKTRFQGNLEEILSDLSMPTRKGKKGSASTSAADMISIGDSWLSFAIKEKLIEPMKGIEDQDWYKGLSDKWKVYLRRNNAGEKARDGETWAVPYRWGSMVIAYKKSKFQQYKLAPIEDWADLWRPELAGRISMVNSPREVVGAVLKYMGASYNTTDLDSQVTGGRTALEKNLASLMKQVFCSRSLSLSLSIVKMIMSAHICFSFCSQIRLFDSSNYLKAFNVGDVWVTVGWSSDVIPVAKRMSNVTVIVPKSGATLWADLWGPLVREPEETKKSRAKLDTNLVSGVPLPEILSKCEFLEPLPEATLLEYRDLIDTVRRQSQGAGLVEKLQDMVSIWVRGFRTKLQPQMKNNT
ncbi:unnamed protein product [Thlaspi arvense]|uniref:Uncharacterized protein n=1 Tax=Thlaspi arvense TaxID=13288 RepID=A0AAU9R979_THLAR|nr:unnamed protein product [Thlaspi arvense]